MKTIYSLLALSLLSISLCADVVLKEKGKKAQNYFSVKTRNLTLIAKKNRKSAAQIIQKSNVEYVDMDEPVAVQKIATKFYAGDYAFVLKYSDSALKKYKYLGWGKPLAYYQSLAYAKTGDIKKAEITTIKAFGYMDQSGSNRAVHDALVDLTKVYADFKNKKQSEAFEALKNIPLKANKAKAYVYNMYGILYLEKGQKDLALNNFLKSILLSKSSSYERDYAFAQATLLYQEKGNSKRIEQLKKIK